jgi:SAM-dependent methyltransferase
MNWVERAHELHVHPRRVRTLAEAAARLLPSDLDVLDIGCGDGRVGAEVARLRPDLTVAGAEVLPREGCRIPVTAFDGRRLPFADGQFGAALIVDVLHHTDEPAVLLREAVRVAREVVVLKDHFCEGWLDRATLRFMDEVGNRRHGVALPNNYIGRAQWEELWGDCHLAVEASDPLPRLYPFPADLVFGRRLHFFARLRKTETV